ncbi:hypothetical protein GQ53DRAFT_754192 [Thozetella sp. PMI_491]|nr:hypothetical protein GQ53DRAFT_754192 [Thozetella sp. PMI_491]
MTSQCPAWHRESSLTGPPDVSKSGAARAVLSCGLLRLVGSVLGVGGALSPRSPTVRTRAAVGSSPGGTAPVAIQSQGPSLRPGVSLGTF